MIHLIVVRHRPEVGAEGDAFDALESPGWPMWVSVAGEAVIPVALLTSAEGMEPPSRGSLR